MSELVEFLLARIGEDEDAANHADWAMQGEWFNDADNKLDEFIRHNSPSRVLAEVAAKRAIVAAEPVSYTRRIPRPYLVAHFDLETDTVTVTPLDGSWTEQMSLTEARERYMDPGPPSLTLRLLASVYSDHPDYDEEWRP